MSSAHGEPPGAVLDRRWQVARSEGTPSFPTLARHARPRRCRHLREADNPGLLEWLAQVGPGCSWVTSV